MNTATNQTATDLAETNNAAANIIADNPSCSRWIVGRTCRMAGDYLDAVQDYTLTCEDENGDICYWVCNESQDGGVVVNRTDGWRMVDLGTCYLDADSGEIVDY